MIQKISEFVINRFLVFILIYAIFLVMARLLVTDIAVLDESEQLVTGSYFALGYNQQPPLYSWIQGVFFWIFGVSIFSISILKNFFIFIIYFSIYKLGILLYKDETKAVLGSISMMLLPQIIWSAQVDQIHTVMLTAMASLTVYWTFRMIEEKSLKSLDFIILGVFCAAGMLAKYNFLLVILGLLVSVAFFDKYRKKLFERRLFLSVLVCFILVLPHFWWLVPNFEFATGRTVDRMGIAGSDIFEGWTALGSLGVATIAFISPFWILFLGFFGSSFKLQTDRKTLLLGGYIAAVLAILAVIVFVFEAASIKERWLQPYLVFFPLFLFGFVEINYIGSRIRKYILLVLTLAIMASFVMILRPTLIDIKGKPSRANYPFNTLTEELRPHVQNEEMLLIFAEDKFIAGNLKLFFPKTTVYTPHVPMQTYELKNQVLFVFEREYPKKIDELIAKGFVCIEERISLKYKYSSNLEYSPKIFWCEK